MAQRIRRKSLSQSFGSRRSLMSRPVNRQIEEVESAGVGNAYSLAFNIEPLQPFLAQEFREIFRRQYTLFIHSFASPRLL